MSNPGRGDPDLASLDHLVDQITARAQGDDEELRAWHRAFKDHVAVPCDGFVIGEPISVVECPRRQHKATAIDVDLASHVYSRACCGRQAALCVKFLCQET